MDRDMDLIRKILLEAEKDGTADPVLRIDGYLDEQIGYHCYLLGRDDLAEVADTTARSAAMTPTARIVKLTEQGYKFLNAARSELVWNQMKYRLGVGTSTAAFAIIQSFLNDFAELL